MVCPVLQYIPGTWWGIGGDLTCPNGTSPHSPSLTPVLPYPLLNHHLKESSRSRGRRQFADTEGREGRGEREVGRHTTSTTRQVEMTTGVILRRATQGPVDWEIHHLFVYLYNDAHVYDSLPATLQKPSNYSNQCESSYNKNSASFWCKFHQCNFCQTEIVMSSSIKIAADMHLRMLTRWLAVYDFSGFLERGAEGHCRHAHTLG